MPGTTMESPLKRRRISPTRSFDVSPLKIATASPIVGTATRSATRRTRQGNGVARGASSTKRNGNGIRKSSNLASSVYTDGTAREVSDSSNNNQGRADTTLAGNTAAAGALNTDTVFVRSRGASPLGSDLSSTAVAAAAVAAMSENSRINGPGPVDEDVYDARHIGRGRPGSSLRSSARASPRPLGTAKASQQNRGAAPSASPARSIATTNDGGRAGSNDSASDAAMAAAANGKRVGTSGAVSMASEDQENLPGEMHQRQQTTEEDEEREERGADEMDVEASSVARDTTFPPAPADVDQSNAEAEAEAEAETGGQENEESVEAPEPELPTLPAQLGLEELPTPPQGLLSSSPSGRKLRRLNKPRSGLSRSPSRTEAPKATAREGDPRADATATATTRIDEEGRPTADGTTTAPTEQQPSSTVEQQTRQPDQGPDEEAQEEDEQQPGIPIEPSGPIITWDLAIERKQNEYENLLWQRARLQAEVRLLESAVPGLDESEAEKRGGRADDHALLELLLSSHPASKGADGSSGKSGLAGKQQRKKEPKHASDLIAEFLPFTLHEEWRVSEEDSTVDQQTSSSGSTSSDPLKSNLSRKLLSHFTPLTISSSGPRIQPASLSSISSSLPSVSPSQPQPQSDATSNSNSLHQEQSFTLTSPDTHLRVELSLVTAPVTNSLVSLKVSSMSSWAEPELLHRFCRSLVTDTTNNTSSDHASIPDPSNSNLDTSTTQTTATGSSSTTTGTGNILTLATGVASYWQLATLRASTWRRISAAHSSLIIPDADADADAVGPGPGPGPGAGSGARRRENPQNGKSAPHQLGRRCLHLGRDGIHLYVFWDIRIDPRTGVAGSELDASVVCEMGGEGGEGVGRGGKGPAKSGARNGKKNGNMDGGEGVEGEGGEKALDRVGELFHLLVMRQGVSRAVRGVVGVVFGAGMDGENGDAEEDEEEEDEDIEDNDDEGEGEGEGNDDKEGEEANGNQAESSKQKGSNAGEKKRRRSRSVGVASKGQGQQVEQVERMGQADQGGKGTVNDNGHDDDGNEDGDGSDAGSSSMDISDD